MGFFVKRFHHSCHIIDLTVIGLVWEVKCDIINLEYVVFGESLDHIFVNEFVLESLDLVRQ